MIEEQEMVRRMAEVSGESEAYINRYFTAMIAVLIEELSKYNKIKLVNFGSFEVVNRAARKGYNAYYKRSIDIPPCKEPIFRPGLELKEKIKNS